MKKEIFITGVAGFLGYSVAKRLLDQGYTVTGVDILNDNKDSITNYRLSILKCYKDKFIFYKESINDYTAMEDIFSQAKPSLVLHLASLSESSSTMDMLNTNINGFYNILELVHIHQSSFIYGSTEAVYGDVTTLDPLSEEFETSKPLSVFASTKKTNELLAYNYATTKGVKTIGLRLFKIYGPWCNQNSELYSFIKNIENEEEIQIPSDNYEDFIFISDAVDGILSTIKYLKTSECTYDIFNIGTSIPQSIRCTVGTISEFSGLPMNTTFRDRIPNEVIKSCADIRKAKSVLGFNPSVDIKEGISRLIQWHKTKNGYK